MKCVFKPIWGRTGSTWEPMAWIGPAENIVPARRKYLNATDKQIILMRQRSKCNFCGVGVKLYPYSNADFDHLVPVVFGGATVVDNIQLLCVPDHRRKSALEATKSVKVLNTNIEPGDNRVYILTALENSELENPVDTKTPIEAVRDGCALSLLTYRRDTHSREHELGFAEMLETFAYVAPNSTA